MAVAVSAMILYRHHHRIAGTAPRGTVVTEATIADRVRQFGPEARQRWQPFFSAAGVRYPPRELVFVGLKLEERLLVYASDDAHRPALVRQLPILAASGKLGPKLREGDRQVPEGLYRIDYLNPNSRHVLSMRINYPNDFDLEHARDEGRDQPGGDIMIHGGNTSIGCLAVGDEPSIDLFILAADTGVENIRVVLSPVDFRVRKLPDNRPPAPAWTAGLYAQIAAELRRLPADGKAGTIGQ
ncbi:MAG: murein L,D-transpeptidase family protein [Tepidisphaerales bacterium]